MRQAAESPGVLQHSRAAYACWSSGGQARTISPMGRGHSPNTQHRVISYTPISLLSPLVRSCPRAMGAQAPPTAAAAGQVTFLPRSHSCRAGELCTFDFQLSRALQRGSSECFVGSALCPPSCCKPFPSPHQARPRAPAQGCPSPANRELCRFPGLVPSLPSRGEKVRAGSRTEASPHAALGEQILGGRAAADRCAGGSQGQYKPQHQNSAQPCPGPLG